MTHINAICSPLHVNFSYIKQEIGKILIVIIYSIVQDPFQMLKDKYIFIRARIEMVEGHLSCIHGCMHLNPSLS